jgi:hypothetical protein
LISIEVSPHWFIQPGHTNYSAAVMRPNSVACRSNSPR